MQFDFAEIHDAPVSITILDGTYSVPRCLNEGLMEWASVLRRRTMDEATAHFLREGDEDVEKVKLGREAKARYLTFWQPPPLDVSELLQRVVEPDGIDFVLRRQLKIAGVPQDRIDLMCRNGDPQQLRTLVDILTTSSQFTRETKIPGEDDAGPLTGPKRESGGSRGTGGGIKRSSPGDTTSTKGRSPRSATSGSAGSPDAKTSTKTRDTTSQTASSGSTS